MRMMLVLLSLLSFSASAFMLQDASQVSPPKSCDDEGHRALDFWVGEWSITDPKGNAAGTSRVGRILDSCAVLEEYSGRNGYIGKSLNAYEARSKKWRQLWVDNRGNVLQFEGGATADGSFVLAGDNLKLDGRPVKDEMRYTKLPEGKVRQLWRRSEDGGSSWKVVFDGVYTRSGAPNSAAMNGCGRMRDVRVTLAPEPMMPAVM